MLSRSIESSVTFARAFSVGKTTGPQPPGTYRVTLDEEEVSGVATLAYRRVATLLHTPPDARSGPHQVFYVEASDLAAALAADRRPEADEKKNS